MKTSNKLLSGGLIFVGVILMMSMAVARYEMKHVAKVMDSQQITFAIDNGVSSDEATVTKILPAFNAIQIEGMGDFVIHQGTTPKLQLTAAKNLISNFKIGVVDNVLVISEEHKFTPFSRGRVHFEITMPQLTKLSIGGTVRVIAKEIHGDNLTLEIGGVADCELAGQVNYFKLSAGGSTHINAEALKAQDVEVEGGGVIHVTVNAAKSLVVNGAGIGDIQYYGHPAKIEKHLSGLMHLEAAE